MTRSKSEKCIMENKKLKKLYEEKQLLEYYLKKSNDSRVLNYSKKRLNEIFWELNNLK